MGLYKFYAKQVMHQIRNTCQASFYLYGFLTIMPSPIMEDDGEDTRLELGLLQQ